MGVKNILCIVSPILLVGATSLGAWFDLAKPVRIYELPAELTEVSALTDVDDHTVACLQDEAATIYFYDLVRGAVTRKFSFAAPGDMEGLTRVGDTYYALRSDGLVYHIGLQGARATVLDTFRLSLPEQNLEGLGYDEERGMVLVSPKDIIKGTPGMRDRRVIHAFDPARRGAGAGPVLVISVSNIIAQARELGYAIPNRTTENGRVVPSLKLRFSSVAVDPVSDAYCILSAADRTLLVLDRKGDLISLHMLPEHLYPKPEGITFLPSGALLISNEGKGSKPNILRFERR